MPQEIKRERKVPLVSVHKMTEKNIDQPYALIVNKTKTVLYDESVQIVSIRLGTHPAQ